MRFSKLYLLLVPPLIRYLVRFFIREFINSSSSGLNKLDLKLLKIIKPSNNGYFVELGANDGIRQSNTLKLQNSFNWSGLLIEPSPIRYRECIDNRYVLNKVEVKCCACVPPSFDEQFVKMTDVDLMSVASDLDVTDDNVDKHISSGIKYLVNHKYKYTFGSIATTLTKLLNSVNAPFNFDLLSLDVEGNELSVLNGLDLRRYQPKWILVEVRDVTKIESYLFPYGYQFFAELSTYPTHSDILYKYNPQQK